MCVEDFLVYNTHREREREGYLFTWSEEERMKTLQSSTWCGGTQIQRDGRVFLQCHSRRSSERERERMLFPPSSFSLSFASHSILTGLIFGYLDLFSFVSFVRSFVLSQKTSLRMNQSFISNNKHKGESKSKPKPTVTQLKTKYRQTEILERRLRRIFP